MSTCNSCDAPIAWAKTEETEKKPARNMPLDADADGKPTVVENGNLVVVGEDARRAPIVRYVKAGSGRHVSHFSTCPNASSHRRA